MGGFERILMKNGHHPVENYLKRLNVTFYDT